jgi:hypothetical protein
MTRPPFDLVEAEEELAGGFNIEYSSIGFALFYLGEYMALVTNSAIFTTLFLGGPDGPAIAGHSIGPFWFALKVLILLYIYIWIRATLPRLRYDQLMDLGWKCLIPASLALLLIVAGARIGKDGFWGWLAVLQCSRVPRPVPRRRGWQVQPQDGRLAELEHAMSFLTDNAFVSFFKGFMVTGKQPLKPKVTVQYPEKNAPSPSASTVATCSTATKTAWKNASGANCAPGSAPQNASTCGERTTRRTHRYRQASATASSTRSTSSAASTATCASRPAPPRRSPSRSSSSFLSRNRQDAIYTKAELVVDDSGKPKVLPWEDWKPGDDRNTSGWVRATSPRDEPTWKGRPLWSGELGYGVRPAQAGQSDPQAADVHADFDISVREPERLKSRVPGGAR